MPPIPPVATLIPINAAIQITERTNFPPVPISELEEVELEEYVLVEEILDF